MGSWVITLIADSAKERLSQAFVDSMAAALVAQGIPAGKPQWLAVGVACDLAVSGNMPRGAVEAPLAGIIGQHPYDAIVQLAENRRKKLLIADMESTIITCECLDELADFIGIRDKIAAITERAMNGELDFASALNERVGLLKGLPESSLQRVYDEKVRLMPGAEKLIKTMRASGAYCMLVSGGFDFFTSRVRDLLGFNEAQSNRLEVKDGKLSGHVIPPILGKEAKLMALQNACKKLGIALEQTLAVGDGANDLPMLLEAGLGIAYHAKPAVRAAAKARVNHADLTALLFAQGYALS